MTWPPNRHGQAIARGSHTAIRFWLIYAVPWGRRLFSTNHARIRQRHGCGLVGIADLLGTPGIDTPPMARARTVTTTEPRQIWVGQMVAAKCPGLGQLYAKWFLPRLPKTLADVHLNAARGCFVVAPLTGSCPGI